MEEEALNDYAQELQRRKDAGEAIEEIWDVTRTKRAGKDDVTWEDSRDLFSALFHDDAYNLVAAESLNNTWKTNLGSVGSGPGFSSTWTHDDFHRDKAKVSAEQLQEQLRNISDGTFGVAGASTSAAPVSLATIVPHRVLIKINEEPPGAATPTFTANDTILSIATTLNLNDT